MKISRMNGIKKFLSYRKVQFLCQVIFGGIFIVAGLSKLLHLSDFADAITTYKILPKSTIQITSYLIATVEFVFGILLVLNLWPRFSAAVLLSLMGIFIFVISSALIRGIKFDCGCFSSLRFSAEKDLPGFYLILRDILFSIPGAIVLFYRSIPKTKI